MIKKAYSILEAIVAVSIVSMIITISVSVINSSLQSLDENGSNLMATSLAQEGIDYFEQVVRTNNLKFNNDDDCKFNKLEDGNCPSLIADDDYDLSWNMDSMQRSLIVSENSVTDDETAGALFNNNQLKVYKKCYGIRSLANNQVANPEDENCFEFYSAQDLGDAESQTKFVRVITKDGNNISSKVYFYVVGKTDLQSIELTKAF
jgi:hypothetical protein